MQISSEYLQKFIADSLLEDIGEGDHSSLACIPAEAKGVAKLLIKEDGILCGVDIARKVFENLEPDCEVSIHIKDGTEVKVGDIAFTLTAKVHTILSGERLALNCMQRMSGIATQTNHIQKKIAHTRCVVLDTRKTTPGIRQLEKYAVFCGGGQNHRMGLYDMIMLKDNHIDYAGGIEAGINRVRQYLNDKNLKLAIEVEARNLDEVKQILDVKPLVDRIMLDNFSPEDIRLALELIANKSETEASGGITSDNIVAYAETGVDFISVGALTHSVKGLDMSLKAKISEN
jgi:nicotinate-nucleotide pyrophosphorylase (carboxylating)